MRQPSGRSIRQKASAHVDDGRSDDAEIRSRKQQRPLVQPQADAGPDEEENIAEDPTAPDSQLASISLYDCILVAAKGDEQSMTVVNISLDAWIDVYKGDNTRGLVDLANFVLHAAGLVRVRAATEKHTALRALPHCYAQRVDTGVSHAFAHDTGQTQPRHAKPDRR